MRRPAFRCNRFFPLLSPTRRDFLSHVTRAGAALLLARAKSSLGADVSGSEVIPRNLRVADLHEDGRRFLLVSPRYQQPGQRLPLLVLLHGLGETGDPRSGAYAWMERYGLGEAWQRLKAPPITTPRPPTERDPQPRRRGEWTDARLAEVNAELATRPFRGFAMACPHMPNPKGPADLDAYAAWIEGALLPRVRHELDVCNDRAHTLLCGVSLGGHVALEVLVRRPKAFGAWGGVQTAIGAWAAPGYADRIAKTAEGGLPTSLFLLTSTQDAWRSATDALAAAFAGRKLAYTLREIPGPHDQPWLREAGTIEMLLHFDHIAHQTRGGASAKADESTWRCP